VWAGRTWGIAAALCVLAASGAALPAMASAHHHAKPKKPKHHKPATPKRGATGPPGPTGPTGPSGVSWQRTVVVSPSASSASGNGALLEAAASALAGKATQTSPYLLWIEPGTYDVGTATLTVPQYVDVQGSGQDDTQIDGEGSIALSVAGGEVRELSVLDTAVGPDAISVDGGLADVTATADGATAATAVRSNGENAQLVDVTAVAATTGNSSNVNAFDLTAPATIEGGSGTASSSAGGTAAGLFDWASATVSGTTLSAVGASDNYPIAMQTTGTTVTVTGSTLVGDDGFFVPAGATLDVGGSEVPGVATAVSGTAECPDDWLPNYAGASSSCT